VIVVDASVIIRLLVEAEPLSQTEMLEREAPWLVPTHVDLEVLNALRRYVFLKRLSSARATQALHDYLLAPLDRRPVTPLLDRIWALRDNLTAYDAAYVALAESTSASLVTRDSKLAAATGHGAKIILI
jgi:predicted nucleic acid-binding protein